MEQAGPPASPRICPRVPPLRRRPCRPLRHHGRAAHGVRPRRPREEAAAFRSAATTLLAAREAGHEARGEALRLNRRLWQAVLIALAAPENALPMPLRQGLATLATTMLREMDRNRPDLAFLAAINQEIAAGLSPCQ
ncbi:flagellar biosynthesis regulator FlaF [Pseudoroseomonas cervicalis]|uniref:flagellar biosynthesis regulator FlaF n=1 Tax=Teichococcus cervicalis TaxID=204525 RepID=UPI0035EB3B83